MLHGTNAPNIIKHSIISKSCVLVIISIYIIYSVLWSLLYLGKIHLISDGDAKPGAVYIPPCQLWCIKPLSIKVYWFLAQLVCPSVCLSGTHLSRALNLHISLSNVSQVCPAGPSHLYLLAYFVGHLEPKVLRFVMLKRVGGWHWQPFKKLF